MEIPLPKRAGAPATPRWFAVILLEYVPKTGFEDRDAGMFYRGFRANGVDTRLIAIGEPGATPTEPVLLASLTQLQDSNWWKQWKLDGVVLYSWGLPKYTAVTRALKAAGVFVVIIVDTDGVLMPQIWPRRFFEVKLGYQKATGKPLPWLTTLLKSWIARSGVRYRGTVEHLSLADVLALPSPLGLQRYARFLELMGSAELLPKLTLLPHPVPTEMTYAPETPKQQQLIAVGGWNRAVKGAPMLIPSLGAILRRHKHYRARVIGAGKELLERLRTQHASDVVDRLEIVGPVPHAQLPAEYQKSQIILNTSNSESFSIACAEALCCGCSVVGQSAIGAMNYFASTRSGTPASHYSPGHYLDAVSAEIAAWGAGERDPLAISKTWIPRVHVDLVVKRLMEWKR